MRLNALAPTVRHPFRPFEGHNDPADAVRLALVVVSFWLLMVCLRAIKEGVRHGQMDRGQVARFVGVGGMAAVLSYASAANFGAPLKWTTIALCVFTGIEIYGVLYIRSEQRNGGTP